MLCKTQDDYRAAVKSSLSKTLNHEGTPLEGRWLVEEYIKGTLYAAELAWVNNKWEVIVFFD